MEREAHTLPGEPSEDRETTAMVCSPWKALHGKSQPLKSTLRWSLWPGPRPPCIQGESAQLTGRGRETGSPTAQAPELNTIPGTGLWNEG